MSDYYYLIAQLPALNFGSQPPITSNHLRELCGALMAPEDCILLDLCALKPESSPLSDSSPVLSSWIAWERSLEQDLARLRASRLKREVQVEEAGTWPETGTIARTAFAQSSPLEAELFLDRSRWDALDSFQGLDPFSREVVFAYCLKLQLLERRALFRTEEGFAEYTAIYASVMGAVPTSNASGEPK